MLSEPKYQNFSLDKVLKKYPVIRLTGGTADKLNAETHNRYRKALEEKDYDTCKRLGLFPPLFPEFVIEIELPDKTFNHILVYYETPEKLYLLYFVKGKKFLEIVDDLSTFTPESYVGRTAGIAPISLTARQMSIKELSAIFNMVYILFCSVSNYMLYYSPELEYAEPREYKGGKRSVKTDEDRREILLKSERLRYTIRGDLPKRNPAIYKTPSWYVRGHYRRMGKDKAWRYVSPTIAYRKEMKGKEEPKSTSYKIKE